MDSSLKDVLAKLLDEKSHSSRPGCRKCGYPGHFSYQCRNDVKLNQKGTLLNASRAAQEAEEEKEKVQMASIESRSIPPSVALSSSAFKNPNMIPITTKPPALSEANSLKQKSTSESKERSHKHKSHHRKEKKRSKKKKDKRKRSKRSNSHHKSRDNSSDSDSDSSSESDAKQESRRKLSSSSKKPRRSRSSSPKRSKRTKETKRSRSSDDSPKESRRSRSRRSRDRHSRGRNMDGLREKLPYKRHSSPSCSPETLEPRIHHSSIQSEIKKGKDRS